jgi:protein-arginine kinase activator protein McsA
MLINQNLDQVQAIMVSNLADNIVFVIKRETIHITLKKAMNFFLEEEEFEKCAKIRDLQILIEKLTNESTNTKDSGRAKRNIKNDR